MKIISQPWGIGDIIFSMTAVRSLNDKILWPVHGEFCEGLNEAYPDILFVDWNVIKINYREKHEYKIQDATVIPILKQDVPVVECMRNKYRYFGLDYNNWKDNAAFYRNEVKERELFKYLGLEEGEPYNVVHNTFLSNFSQKRDIRPPDNGFKTVYVSKIPGYSLFNWCKVYEQATTVHAVNSSNVYLFELIEMQATEIKLYKKIPLEYTHDAYKDLLTPGKYQFE